MFSYVLHVFYMVPTPSNVIKISFLMDFVEGEWIGSGQGSGGIGNVLGKLNKHSLKWVSNRNVWAFNMFQHRSKAILIHPLLEPNLRQRKCGLLSKNILPVKLHCTLGWGGGWLGGAWAILEGKVFDNFVKTGPKKTERPISRKPRDRENVFN